MTYISRASCNVLDTGLLRQPMSPSITTLHDFSREYNHGTMTDITWDQQSSRIWAMSLNGSTSCVDCGSDSSLDLPLYISVEAWLYNTQDTNWTICGKGPTASTDTRNYIFQATNLHYVVGGIEYQCVPTTTTAGLINEWHYWAGTIDTVNDEMYLYLDGTINGSKIGTALPSMPTVTNNLQIGRVNNGAGTYRYYLDGYIALIRLYTYILTSGQVLQHYENTKHLFGV